MSQFNPLDNKVVNGGFCGIIRTLGCIGDSLSSGQLESKTDGTKDYHNYFEYSWGQFLGRAAGITVHNFSSGGMTAKAFVDIADKWYGFRNPEKKCQAYIIALGVNDTERGVEIGNVATDVHPEDYEKNADTFAGNMGRIIGQIHEIEPKARIFLMTIPKNNWNTDAPDDKKVMHSKVIYDLAEKFKFTYVMDMHKYSPIWDDEFKKVYFMGGHLNSMGYKLASEYVMSYMDYIIRENYEDFAQIGFVGRENDLHNEDYIW